jgi:hypothetical protein
MFLVDQIFHCLDPAFKILNLHIISELSRSLRLKFLFVLFFLELVLKAHCRVLSFILPWFYSDIFLSLKPVNNWVIGFVSHYIYNILPNLPLEVFFAWRYKHLLLHQRYHFHILHNAARSFLSIVSQQFREYFQIVPRSDMILAVTSRIWRCNTPGTV